MTTNRFIAILLLSTLILGYACRQKGEIRQTKNPGEEKESLIRVNEYLVNKDKEVIENYIRRRGWEMELTKTGLWYMIYEEGGGKLIERGNLVTIEYSLYLLDGTVCYQSDEDGPKQFVVGKESVEPGLDEGIRLLKLGDKARFILPPHLAYGLLGDEKKIPTRSVIVYDLEVAAID
jgi:FKBP-type peptidyl-prolyl cis-trans isomerase FkpA